MRDSGFTLLELLVAVTIMIIISGVGLGAFTFSQRKSRDARRKNDLSQVARALEVFNEDFGRYPVGSGGKIVGCQLIPTDPLGSCTWGEVFAAHPGGVYQLYMTKLPDDPKVNLDYYYESNGNNIKLYAALENQKDKDYRSDLTQDCGGVRCNYLLTEYGVEVK